MTEKLKTILAGGGAHLGDLLWWTLSDAAIDRSTLEAHWASANLRLGRETEAEIVFAVVEEHELTDGSVS
jgi:hypothetical protein